MPTKPPRACSHPGCPAVATKHGRCAEHQRQEYALRDSPSRRGYDRRWKKVRRMFLNEHPFCFDCGHFATEVHHATPKRNGGEDSAENLTALCKSCHSRRTAAEREGGVESLRIWRPDTKRQSNARGVELEGRG